MFSEDYLSEFKKWYEDWFPAAGNYLDRLGIIYGVNRNGMNDEDYKEELLKKYKGLEETITMINERWVYEE